MVRRAATAAACAAISACVPGVPTVDMEIPPPLPRDSIENVVFLVGDAGEALPGRSPVLARLRQEVEGYAGVLQRDSAVAVFYLGDIVYPDGVRDRDHPDFPADSARVAAQVDVVSGPRARAHRSPGVFIAGNHDWGGEPEDEGLWRLENLDALLERMKGARGAEIDLVPDAGDPGPAVVDLGPHSRFILLDTHWWLQAREDPREDSVILATTEALETAGERHVTIAAHHPFRSGGSHGGPLPVWEGLGIIWLLRNTGSLIQDLNSVPYRELRLGLQAAFAEVGRPLIWAGGHDHSLQVLRARDEDDPVWSLVSGSGSKLTDVARVEGLVFARDQPGFMRLTFMRDGAVHLHVYSAPDRFLHCEGADPTGCIEEGTAAFRVVFATRLN